MTELETKLSSQNEALRAQVAALRNAVTLVEFRYNRNNAISGESDDDAHWCRECGGRRSEGHYELCAVGQAMSASTP